MEIKKGDNVVVIAGKDKGKKGKVLKTSPKSAKVVVEGVNIVTKHKKPRSAQDKGGIVKQTNPIDSSNVMVVCSTCGKATRIGHKEIDGKKARICKKCGASLDKDLAKAVKKETKSDKTEKPAEKKTSTKSATSEKSTTKTATATKSTAKKTTKAE